MRSHNSSLAWLYPRKFEAGVNERAIFLDTDAKNPFLPLLPCKLHVLVQLERRYSPELTTFKSDVFWKNASPRQNSW